MSPLRVETIAKSTTEISNSFKLCQTTELERVLIKKVMTKQLGCFWKQLVAFSFWSEWIYPSGWVVGQVHLLTLGSGSNRSTSFHDFTAEFITKSKSISNIKCEYNVITWHHSLFTINSNKVGKHCWAINMAFLNYNRHTWKTCTKLG